MLRYFLPRARREGVAEELRGWNWNQPPLSPIYECSLAVYEVANGYCDSARDLYWRRVERVKAAPNKAMVQGRLFHALVAGMMVETKRRIYKYGVDAYPEILREINELGLNELLDEKTKQAGKTLDEETRAQVLDKMKLLLAFERGRIVARMQEVLVKQPYIGVDSLAALTVPVVVEHKLDGSFLGLSAHLSTDAYQMGESMIVDLKFGEPRPFHRLATTGYALAMEAMYEFPVNVGCVVYVSFAGDRVRVQRDIHLINDELRQWFIEARDTKARLVAEELDPGMAKECQKDCPYAGRCKGGEA